MIDFPIEGGTGSAYLAQPATTPAPGVLVLHAWWGLTPVFRDICDRLAQAGFVALAPDIFEGRTTASVEQAEQQVGMAQQNEQRTQAIVFGALDALRAHSASAGPAGVVGFSFGAAWATVLASVRPDDLRAVVLYYGSYPGFDFGPARAAYLGHFAEQDQFEPLEYVQQMESELRTAGRDVTFHVYPQTKHWFVENNRPEYDAAAAGLAWQRTLAFLGQQLGASAI